MSAIHVVAYSRNGQETTPAVLPTPGILETALGGVSIAAQIGETQSMSLLMDVATALVDLASGQRSRVALQFYATSQTWELGLEADGNDILVSLYRAGKSLEIAVYERKIPLKSLCDGVLNELRTVQNSRSTLPSKYCIEATFSRLQEMRLKTLEKRRLDEVTIAPKLVRGLAFQASARMRRSGTMLPANSQVERTDLHALLFQGTFSVCARGRTWSVPNAPVYFVAEQLLELAESALLAQQSANPLFRRVQVGSVRLGIRLAPADGPLAVSLANAATGQTNPGLTFPELDPHLFAKAVLAFAASIHETLLEHDPSQRNNLRLQEFRDSARRVAEYSKPKQDQCSLVNSRPEIYKRYAAPSASSRGRWEHGAGLRFNLRFTATVPQIDLKSTQFCGDALIVGSLKETACLDPISGATRWRIAAPRAASIATPVVLIKLFPDGRMTAHDWETGSQQYALRLTPRAQGGACGAVVCAPGLPRLLAICEGDRRVTAVDLVSGEVRWRYTSARPAPLRVRRAGALLLVAGGDSVLVALDSSSGDMVWRACDRLPFTGDVCVAGDSVYAMSGGAQGRSTLHAYDAWSGELKWKKEVEDRAALGQSPVVAGENVLVAVRDARGCGMRAFSRSNGAEVWKIEPGQFPRSSAWAILDDLLIVNGANGTLTCFDAGSGAVRYRQVFSETSPVDQPRRLEPVLRNGALFVPQLQVHVLRPTDGSEVGTIPSDLIPDLVRVDERWGVLVAEESGHVSTFSVSPLLVRIK